MEIVNKNMSQHDCIEYLKSIIFQKNLVIEKLEEENDYLKCENRNENQNGGFSNVIPPQNHVSLSSYPSNHMNPFNIGVLDAISNPFSNPLMPSSDIENKEPLIKECFSGHELLRKFYRENLQSLTCDICSQNDI
jgi:hypothetical protein